MFGFGGQDSDDKNAEALFERFEINTSGRKYGEGGYGCAAPRLCSLQRSCHEHHVA